MFCEPWSHVLFLGSIYQIAKSKSVALAPIYLYFEITIVNFTSAFQAPFASSKSRSHKSERFVTLRFIKIFRVHFILFNNDFQYLPICQKFIKLLSYKKQQQML